MTGADRKSVANNFDKCPGSAPSVAMRQNRYVAKRSYLSQADVPLYSVKDALRIPQALANEYGKKPAKPLDVAKALDLTPGRYFKDLTGSAVAHAFLTLERNWRPQARGAA